MSEEMKMSVSSKVKSPDGQGAIYVTFEDGDKFAEAELYSLKILRSKGLSDEEAESLKQYLSANKVRIEEMAGGVNPMKAFLGK